MNNKFEIPSNFSFTSNENGHQLIINAKNPIWVGFSLALLVAGGIMGYFISYIFLTLCAVGLIKIVLESSKTILIEFHDNSLSIEGIDFKYEEIKSLTIECKRHHAGGRGSEGSYDKTWINIINTENKETPFGQELTIDNQKDLIFIINQFRKKDTDFINSIK